MNRDPPSGASHGDTTVTPGDAGREPWSDRRSDDAEHEQEGDHAGECCRDGTADEVLVFDYRPV
ncbi:hypothetical protein [Halobaculum sp. MBLA0143]|uniref:hypothetical protein n=1 Tax=Halobaculum sp. MBLA0143 TaxID=3079933 RepID=UPI003524F35E